MIRIACYALTLSFAIAPLAAAQTPPPPPAAPAAQAVAPSDAPIIKMISTGTGEKRQLRYKLSAGARERIDLRMQASVTMDIPEAGQQTMDTPAIVMGVNVDVTAVAPNGDATSTITIADASMAGADVPEGALDQVKGLSAVMITTSRGLVKQMSFDDARITDPMMKQALASTGLDKLAVPMPEDAVGVGAKWDVVQGAEANGIKVDQKTTYEVVAMDPASTTLAVTMEQTADEQTLTPPGMPSAVQIKLVSMEATGTGRMTFPEGAVALFGDMLLKSKVVMDVTAEGQQQRMSTATDMKMTISRGKR